MALFSSRCLAGGEWRIGLLIRTVLVHAICVAASFFGAYGLVNLYNLSKHSPANTLKEFLIGTAMGTSRSSLPIWERNDPETYQWFCETYELDQTFPYYEEEFQFYRKK